MRKPRSNHPAQNPDILLKHWPSKILAGFLLGAPLCLGVLGDLGLLFNVSAQLDQPSALLLRWVPGIVWTSSVCFALSSRSALRAWGYMIASNILVWGCYAVFYALRIAGWISL